MKIKKITFENYRCFNNLEFNFSTSGLNVIIGKNGAGKTELLFAIEWALYGLDFSRLHGKENTAYALNSGIYRKYNDPNYNGINRASVTIDFTHNLIKRDKEVEVDFCLKKYAIYMQSGKRTKPTEEIHSELSYIEENGTRSLPLEDEKCSAMIKKIIPRKILGGILFDGERMKELSNDDEHSREAIDGFISEITNIEQLIFTKMLLEQIKKEYSRQITNLGKSTGYNDIAELNEDILKLNNLIDRKQQEVERKDSEKNRIELELNNVRAKLEASVEIQSESIRRGSAENIRNNELKTSIRKLDALQDNLANGFRLHCGELFEQVEKLVDENDVPIGLTIQAAQSILSRPTCICGEKWTPEHRSAVESLINELPPQNLNSSISQTIKFLKAEQQNIASQLKKSYLDIIASDNVIREQERIIAEASNRIGSSNIEEIRNNEKRREVLARELGGLDSEIKKLTIEIKSATETNKIKQKSIEDLERNNSQFELLAKKDKFTTACVNIVRDYIELSKKESLDAINNLISKAFMEISEDYDRGKRIYITQFIKPKYRIVTYYQAEYDRLYSQAIWSKIFAEYNLDNSEQDNEEIRQELIILKASDSLSTGQRKIVTLSFVKAVTDFAMSRDGYSENRITKEYPLFIDAPFSELSGENLSKFAEKLPNFNKQSIVMMDPDIFKDIKVYFEDHIVKHYQLIPSKDGNNTTLQEIK